MQVPYFRWTWRGGFAAELKRGETEENTWDDGAITGDWRTLILFWVRVTPRLQLGILFLYLYGPHEERPSYVPSLRRQAGRQAGSPFSLSFSTFMASFSPSLSPTKSDG